MVKKETVIFVITNTAGLGHLTRGLAIAKRLQALNIESVFFTTSVATKLIREQGFKYVYLPTKSLFPESVSMSWWVDFKVQQLEEVIKTYKPVAIVYEGVLPSNYMTMAVEKYKGIKWIWIKRENYKSGWQNLNELEAHFDLVIIPEEIGESYSGNLETDKRKYCEPITILDKKEAYSRKKARDILGVNNTEKLYYIQLGVGCNITLEKILAYVQQSLLKRKNTKVVIGESVLDVPIQVAHENIKVIRSYPNACYFNGIDFAIAAAGYNTFHELVGFKVPTLFIPNEFTVADDQAKRVTNLEQNHAVLRLYNLSELDAKLDLLERYGGQMIKNLKKYQRPNGALEAAKMIANALKE